LTRGKSENNVKKGKQEIRDSRFKSEQRLGSPMKGGGVAAGKGGVLGWLEKGKGEGKLGKFIKRGKKRKTMSSLRESRPLR